MDRTITMPWHWVLICVLLPVFSYSQQVIKGTIVDAELKDPLFGATVYIDATGEGASADLDGYFELPYSGDFPVTLSVSYTGYERQEMVVESADQPLKILLGSTAFTIEAVSVTSQRISEKQKSSALTVESMDVLAIRETPSDNFYDGLGNLKGVDLTAASLAFKVINTRGFNSTSPVRSLQLIDGVDNQAPGLNFSLGNFLGSPDLDVLRVDIIAGASSAFYGPNAFNGVISMETKNPFLQRGLAASVKAGERSLFETALRYADDIKNKNGDPFMAFKFNFFFLRANDWEATNYDPVDGTETGRDNPGGYDAVNRYGDEYFSGNDFSTAAPWKFPGLGQFHRTAYNEMDLVDYNTRNIKSNVAVHFRTQPKKNVESPEIIVASNFGYGTTVYQGDNRFSLRNILFFQNRLEYRKKDKFFIRAYATNEDAGDSYDPYFTALRLQEEAKSNNLWARNYSNHWLNVISPKAIAAGYPQLEIIIDPELGPIGVFDYEAREAWLEENQGLLFQWHAEAADVANMPDPANPNTQSFLAPGTPEFQEAFDRITSAKNNEEEEGTRFYDKSALYHLHGEHKFNPSFFEEITVGGNGRLYRPNSEGTIFTDTAGTRISNYEFGAYTGVKKNLIDNKLRLSATVRVDKNQNFDLISTPAFSAVWNPSVNTFIRGSFSSAIRNPTLTDQYLNLNVGPATLLGNLNGFNNLVELDVLRTFLETQNPDTLQFFDVAPVKPEKVRTFELGFRSTLFDAIYVDAGYYYSIYRDFLGFNLGADVEFDPGTGIPTEVNVYRVAANSINTVTTQGFNIGLNYYFEKYYMVSGNYSWNKLISDIDDPIIPAFNTPEHKFNISLSGRDIVIRLGKAVIRNVGFNVNYKWIEGFLFEGSPQFTGFIPTYDLLDAQVNYQIPNMHTTIKVGASNLLNNEVFQTYGGPRIGRLAYVSLVYDFNKKITD